MTPFTPDRRSLTQAEKISIPLLIFLCVQFGTAIWWASRITAEIAYVRAALEERTNDRYLTKDAQKDFDRRDRDILALDSRVKRLEHYHSTR